METTKKRHACGYCGGDKPPHLNYAQLASEDLESIAYHEAGHFVVASHFKLQPVAFLADSGCRCISQKAFCGVTIFGKEPSKIQGAIFDVSGVLGEHALKKKDFDSFYNEGFEDYYSRFEEGALSAGDAKPTIGRTDDELDKLFVRAAKILWKLRKELSSVASELKQNGIYPRTATRYCYFGQIFMESLPPLARVEFAKGSFKPEKPFSPSKNADATSLAFSIFARNVNKRGRGETQTLKNA